MGQEISENDKEVAGKTGEAADSGQPGPTPPKVARPTPALTTLKPRAGAGLKTGSPINRPGGPNKEKSYGVELVMGLVLAALVLGIAVVFLVTSSGGFSGKTTGQPTPTIALLGELSPRNAATAQAVISRVANQDLGTAVPLPPTPSGSPVSSDLDSQGLSWPASGGNPARTRLSPPNLISRSNRSGTISLAANCKPRRSWLTAWLSLAVPTAVSTRWI